MARSGQKFVMPRFTASDAGLEDALNTLASAIEAVQNKDITLAKGTGTVVWTPNEIILRPKSQRGAGSTAHPFKISVAFNDTTNKWDATVTGGIADVPIVRRDAGSDGILGWERERVGGAELAGIENNSDNGVWLKYQLSAPRVLAPEETGANPYKTDTYETLFGAGGVFISQPYTIVGLVKSDTFFEPYDIADFVLDDGAFGYYYIGKVSVADAVVTIDQWQKTDIQLPPMTWAHGTISNDPTNGISSDGGGAYLSAASLRDAGSQ